MSGIEPEDVQDLIVVPNEEDNRCETNSIQEKSLFAYPFWSMIVIDYPVICILTPLYLSKDVRLYLLSL